MNVDVVYSEQLRRCEHHRRAVDSACAVNMVVKSIVHEMRDDLACKDEEGQILQSQTLEEKQYVSMYLVFKSTIFYPPDDATRGGYEPLAY